MLPQDNSNIVPMRGFIAQSMSRILNDIRRARFLSSVDSATQDVRVAVSSRRRGDTNAPITVDVETAERIANASFIFPYHAAEKDTTWHIFVESHFDVNGEKIFQISGSISGNSDPTYFVDLAYSLIFTRPVDPNGAEVYTPLLKNESMTQYSLLSVLANSDEARMLARNLIIIPEPSNWLSSDWRVGYDPGSFPDLLVKKS